MPDIQPFAALRYDTEKVGDLGHVVAPPYDVIKGEQRDRLAAEPYSAVKLTLEKSRDGDTAEDNAYTRSRDLFQSWQRDGILVRDEAPALYVLAQDFEVGGRAYTRMHLVCACRLYEFDEKVILPHEQILQGPKDDRQRLIETTEANYEPLFGLTLGDSKNFRQLMADAAASEPMEDVTLDGGERQRVWTVSDPDAIQALQRELADSTVVIADGHHRYNASLGVKRERNAAAGAGPWDYAMMTLAAMDDPDLLVLPTHRIVTGIRPFHFEPLVERLDTYFLVEEKDSADEVLAAMDVVDGVAIGMLAGVEGQFLLTPWRLDDAADAIRIDHSDAWKRLDVSILHGLIMDRMLGLGAGESPQITYTRYAAEAETAVQSGGANLSFLLKSTPKEAVQTIALLGETMPQKSTYFYPKLVTGLLIRTWT